MKRVALVGRTNVGKTSLFNALLKKKHGIIENEDHITRDFLEDIYEDENVEFILQDTGGWDFSPENEIQKLATKKSEEVIKNADLILLVIDGKLGISEDDLGISRIIKKLKKNVILVVNKIDSEYQREIDYEFFKLGIKEYVFVSAIHKRGFSELLEKISKILNLKKSNKKHKNNIIKIAITGVPNVGKSSLVNKILGWERAIVFDKPGTTRDTLDTPFKYKKREFLIIDTAGIRKRGKIKDPVEYYSVNRAKKAIKRADICIFLLDATANISHHEQTLAGFMQEHNKCVIMALSKWDLVKDKEHIFRKKQIEIEEKLYFYRFAPRITISTKENKHIGKLLDTVLKVYEAKNKFVDSQELKFEIERALMIQSFTIGRKTLLLKSIKQTHGPCPTFDIKTNIKEKIPRHIKQYIENTIRDLYEFSGCPLRLIFK